MNGEKKWITNGMTADYFTVACRTGDAGGGMGGLSLLLLEKTMPGIACRQMQCQGIYNQYIFNLISNFFYQVYGHPERRTLHFPT